MDELITVTHRRLARARGGSGGVEEEVALESELDAAAVVGEHEVGACG